LRYYLTCLIPCQLADSGTSNSKFRTAELGCGSEFGIAVQAQRFEVSLGVAFKIVVEIGWAI
jgi:hypothetical protein